MIDLRQLFCKHENTTIKNCSTATVTTTAETFVCIGCGKVIKRELFAKEADE